MNKVGMLVQKDLIYLSTSLKKLIFMSVTFAFVFSMGNVTLALTVIPCMVVYLLTYGIFAYEEKNKMHLLNASLPVDRNALCTSKYLTGLIYIITSTLISMLGVAVGAALGTNDGSNLINLITNAILLLFTVSLMYNGILLPLIIHFGTIKMKYIVFALYFISFVMIGAMNSSSNAKQVQVFMQNSLTNTSSLMMLIGSIIVYIISYIISIGLYTRKEFK